MTTIDAVRVLIDWTDKWPRDHTGDVIESARIQRPPITIPAPVMQKKTEALTAPAGTGNPAAPGVYTLTDMKDIDF